METDTSAVRCRGPRGGAVEAGFLNAFISTLAAGGSRVCGVRKNDGSVRCSGGGVLAPRKDLYVDGLAVGDSHACGLLRPNYTTTCWSLGGATTTLYYPAVGMAFELLVASGNLTCGLVSTNFSLLCWSMDGLMAAEVNLPPILPGVCVSDNSSCKCGLFPDSERFCKVSGNVICKGGERSGGGNGRCGGAQSTNRPSRHRQDADPGRGLLTLAALLPSPPPTPLPCSRVVAAAAATSPAARPPLPPRPDASLPRAREE
uniref:non-specific serine/threonine protein kinase n=1 Tax=Oryza meridionalis TaxID=40149 RepID=A0A0E0D260_9ORYZ